ncbi:ATP-dependent DNA ligase [Hydrocarboniphaga effusa]|uniref:ATP-dependent DNA ligase n=1 Tax=Hydrocarboniphaga effusa TaxID=243629 RepID=UPI00398BFCC5
MERFARLYAELDATTSTSAKVAAMRRYFESAPAEDAAWGLFFLQGGRLKRLIAPTRLRDWITELTQLSPALVEESYAHVGDLAETVALLIDTRFGGERDDPLIPSPAGGRGWREAPGEGKPERAAHSPNEPSLPSLREGLSPASGREDEPATPALHECVELLQNLSTADESTQRETVFAWWRRLPFAQCFLFTKLLTGSLRVGVSSGLAARALAAHAGLDTAVMQHRLMGNWQPSAESYASLLQAGRAEALPSQPYPFCLAHPIDEATPEAVGELAGYLAEWKWDGIRGQLIRRAGQTWLWSRGEDLLNGRFPEVEAMAERLPDGSVLDGELLAWREGAVMPFSALQTRIGRKNPGRKSLADAPVTFLPYDLLEWRAEDWRGRPLSERRAQLETVCTEFGLLVSPRVDASDWDDLKRQREQARERGVEGLMLKRLDSPYTPGRKTGLWWKWKLGALTVDCVLIYAQAGHGRRSNLYSDYTLAVWDGDALVPVAKAYSGLTDEELASMDRWIRSHTIEKFGPVRSVEPVQVFEIAFENIQESRRHKAGVALRFPRIARWRRDKPAREADTLATLKQLLATR